MSRLILVLALLFSVMTSRGDDLKLPEDFKSGDVISADTFNQIFDEIEKINRSTVDEDLLGTWTCSAFSAYDNAPTNGGWVKNGLIWGLEGGQITLSRSGDSASIIEPYSFSTTNPNPFYRGGGTGTNEAKSGTYAFFAGMIMFKGFLTTDTFGTPLENPPVYSYLVSRVSKTRLVFTATGGASGNMTDVTQCDAANPVASAPIKASAKNKKTSIELTWEHALSDEDGFYVYRRLSSQDEMTKVSTQTTLTYTDTNLEEGQTAFYSVSAYNSVGESVRSKTVRATLDDTPPVVVSSSPSNSQQSVATDLVLSLSFSESVKVVCPIDYVAVCGDTGQAILIEGDQGVYLRFDTLTNTATDKITIKISGLNTQDTIKVTVDKDWVEDANGVKMTADYKFEFKTN